MRTVSRQTNRDSGQAPVQVGLLALFLALSGAAAPAPADLLAPPDTTTFFGGTTDTILVEAARFPDTPFPVAPALVTIVPLEQERGGADLAELLSRSAGLQMRRYGGLGAEALPSIRGSTAAQVVVMVDGIPLSDAQDGTVDLASLPLERFSQAEVYRGLVPARFGGIGGAGAVNLVSRPAGGSGSSARLFGGSFGDAGGRLIQDWCSADRSRALLLLVHGRRIDNLFEFRDHNQTFASSVDDSAQRRINADFVEWGGYLRGRWESGRVRTSLAAGYFDREGGRPGPLGYPSPDARVWRSRADGHLTLRSRGESLRLEVIASRTRERLRDDEGEVGFDPPGTTRSVSDDLCGRVSVSRDAILPQLGIHWRAGVDWRRQWYSEQLNEDEDPRRVRTTVGVTSSLQVDLFGPRLGLQTAWRWQWAEDNFPPLPALPSLPEKPLAVPHLVTAVSPSAGLVWEVLPGRLFCEAHGSRTVRLPTWIELFGHRGGIEGNRDLVPEEVTTWDLALRWRLPGRSWRTRLAWFQARTDSTIIFIQSSHWTHKAWNSGRTETGGLEWEISGRLPGGGHLAANLTWQEALDRGSQRVYHGKQLPFLPPVEAAIRIDQPLRQWRFGVAVIHQAANFRDRRNWEQTRAPARTLCNVSLGWTWPGGKQAAGPAVAVTAELINLTENQVYDVEGFPLPGRSFRLSAQIR